MSGVEDTVVESPKKTGRVKYFVSVGVLALVAVIACVYLFVVAPHNRAVKAFEVAAAQVQEKNSALQAEIDAAQQSLDKGDKPLDVATQDALTVAVADAGLVLRAIPEMPSSTSDIEAATEALNEPLDYSATSKTLADASQAFDKSVRQLGQVMAPSQDFVVSRLGKAPGVSDIEPVTEANDPNRQLNKAGGYTAAVYFHFSGVEGVEGVDSTLPSIQIGTDSGGCIEVYRTVEDANKRNGYLASFDGQGVLDTGSHKVLGTVIVRTSYFLTASQQNALTDEIEAILTELD
jgi:ebhA protein, putative